ncbi:DUF5960 family protein [Enterococcus villorum]|uniref:Uncharacterized protein n=2 Tax=Enterococcus villorum TaxID=112904 RepID=A0A511IYF9_9ENTE|nr:DUF5960 family protein [Enterococcus villorum]EOH89865.1 hypothetical protein UAO_01109 [Enterococcus villorum ATCC 700913]EOW78097.1 hypothetical protein I591_00952 [Enterococcus villorum ATCC 700913]GEL90812.1 hypothetical protein EVI01_01490 [Enterococcus villorum]
MEKEYFIQQAVFLKDYKNVAKKENIDMDVLADQVISHLNETQEDYYTMSAEEAKDGISHRFPFSRRIYSDENDGTINTEYTYEGEPYILQTEEDK